MCGWGLAFRPMMDGSASGWRLLEAMTALKWGAINTVRTKMEPTTDVATHRTQDMSEQSRSSLLAMVQDGFADCEPRCIGFCWDRMVFPVRWLLVILFWFFGEGLAIGYSAALFNLEFSTESMACYGILTFALLMAALVGLLLWSCIQWRMNSAGVRLKRASADALDAGVEMDIIVKRDAATRDVLECLMFTQCLVVAIVLSTAVFVGSWALTSTPIAIDEGFASATLLVLFWVTMRIAVWWMLFRVYKSLGRWRTFTRGGQGLMPSYETEGGLSIA